MIPAMRLTFLRFGVFAASLVSLSSCFFFAPDEEVIVPLPVEGTYARIQVWGNTISDGRYEVVVASPLGSSRQKLWEDWGPAQRASLYWSLDGRLIVIGGGGNTAMFVVPRAARPRRIPFHDWPREGGEDWRYLGAVDGDDLTYFPPSAQRECIPLHGAGFSLYRRSHQDQGSCSNL